MQKVSVYLVFARMIISSNSQNTQFQYSFHKGKTYVTEYIYSVFNRYEKIRTFKINN